MPKKLKEASTEEPRDVATVTEGVLTFTDERAPVSLSSEGATNVQIHYGADRVKSLSVTMIGHKPTFSFEGIWSGADVKVIQRHLRIAYFQHTRDLRRALAARPNKGGHDNV